MQLCFHVRMNIVTVAKSNIQSALDLEKDIYSIYTHIYTSLTFCKQAHRMHKGGVQAVFLGHQLR